MKSLNGGKLLKQPLYLTSHGILQRKDNTLVFIPEGSAEKKVIPINAISGVMCFGKVTLKSGATDLLFEKNLPVHFFSQHGSYKGSYLPRAPYISGKVIISQAAHYLNERKRWVLASALTKGVIMNIKSVLTYWNAKHDVDLSSHLKHLSTLHVPDAGTINDLRYLEGQAWQLLYAAFNDVCLNPDFTLHSRIYNPPPDPINSLISLLNMMLYGVVISELYQTQLHPAISYVHEPHERRFSLALDVADVFKPVYTFRILIRLINRQQITLDDFDSMVKVKLKESSLKKVAATFQEWMMTTIRHPTLRRKVSYRELIRLECYKLVKHVLDDKPYKPYTFKFR